jgi:peptidoglycan hydrolase CwlO-like protein
MPMAPTRPRPTAEGSSQVEPGAKNTARHFMEVLAQYKELIAIMVFFVATGSGVMSYFATKEQVRVAKCLIYANLEITQYQLQFKMASDDRHQLDQEETRLSALEKRSADDTTKIHDLDESIAGAKRRIQSAEKKIEEDESKIRLNKCEDETSTPPPSGKE